MRPKEKLDRENRSMQRLCRVGRCQQPPVDRGVCKRHRMWPDRLCACGRMKGSLRSKLCVRCHHEKIAARRAKKERCKCGKPKTYDAKRCFDCHNEAKVTRRCACGERVSSSQSTTCAACRANAVTKMSRARLDYMRVWRKMNPKGPPCSVCGEKLSVPRKPGLTSPPLCMGCRASTGQLAAGLRKEAPRARRNRKQTHTSGRLQRPAAVPN